MLLPLSVVVDDFRVGYFAVLPHKTHPPLLIDADAMLAPAVALECLKLVAGRHRQVAERRRRIEVLELLARPLLYLSVETLDEFTAEYCFRPLVLERPDHFPIVTYLVPIIQVSVQTARHRHRGDCELARGLRKFASGSARTER